MRQVGVLAPLLCGLILSCSPAAQAEVKELAVGGYSIEIEVLLPAAPEAVYDAATGDISGWWDHSVSGHPKKMYIEAKPGGGFYEIFNDSGDGVLHATVNYAERGKRLRFTGPLGFGGRALDLVTTYDLKPDGKGTRMHVTCNSVGQISAQDAKAIDMVWQHFIGERLKGYIESGDYLKKSKAQ